MFYGLNGKRGLIFLRQYHTKSAIVSTVSLEKFFFSLVIYLEEHSPMSLMHVCSKRCITQLHGFFFFSSYVSLRDQNFPKLISKEDKKHNGANHFMNSHLNVCITRLRFFSDNYRERPIFFCNFRRYLPTYVLQVMYYLLMYYVRLSFSYLPQNWTSFMNIPICYSSNPQTLVRSQCQQTFFVHLF